uniref:Uncharacterized protein n=1 Tax=Clytia hemisphaerica TaxID=252671 RepID=A0A7M6DRA3_9CNID
MEECPDVLDEALNESNYAHQAKKLLKVKSLPKKLTIPEAAYLLMGKRNMTQRTYKNLKKVFNKSGVNLPNYPDLKGYCNNLDAGEILKLHRDDDNCSCMGYGCTVRCTLEMIFKTDYFYRRLCFLSHEQQQKLFKFLTEKDPELYSNLDESKKTVIIRDTGDNFRAAGRFPTEQTSFSLLNLPDLANSPYGQHITTLLRGGESRQTLKIHVGKHYQQLHSLVKEGITLMSPCGNIESFNVIVIFVADLSFVKEVLGRCQCTQTFGCFHCELPIKDWSSVKRKLGSPQSIQKMKTRGDNSTSAYKKFTLTNYGQWAPVMLKFIILELLPPCGLHLILAHHRYLWKSLYEIVSKRKQEHVIPVALKKIGCNYLAFQLKCYHTSKKKHYDGSEPLKMIGNDCKLLEDNMDVFLTEFVNERN